MGGIHRQAGREARTPPSRCADGVRHATFRGETRLPRQAMVHRQVRVGPQREIGDADEPEYQLAPDLAELFTEVGFEAPQPVAVMRTDHQVAQKLHAISGERSERARDLVDLQLIADREDLDFAQVAATCIRLFDYRRQQSWPPTVAAGPGWETIYMEAADGLDVLPAVGAAVAWINDFVLRIAKAGV
ncbi:MAG: nucleotidyl transferase AbiEii/AbiGii toxin family protein [Micropruina sp.]